jgi:lipopolysaccharide export system protein LptC
MNILRTITPQHILALGALGAIAAFTFWVLQVSAPREVREREARHEPDYHFSAPRITRFGVDGTLELELTARHAVHFPDDDTVALDELKVDVRAPDGAAWTMVAARGHAPMAGERVTLEGGVRIGRPAGGAGGAIELTTDHVVLNTRAQLLETDAAVEIVHGANRVTAVGLSADLGRDHITLRNRVRGTYATP